MDRRQNVATLNSICIQNTNFNSYTKLRHFLLIKPSVGVKQDIIMVQLKRSQMGISFL